MQVLSPEMKRFLEVGSREEAISEPRYHYQTYAAAGFTSQSYFGSTVGSATNGLRDTNMEKANAIGNPKRFSVEAVKVDLIQGNFPSQTGTTMTGLMTHLNDLWEVFSAGHLQFRSIDKTYLNVAPLWQCPPGAGLLGSPAVSTQLASAADRLVQMGVASCGLPAPQAIRWLKSPIPLQAETPFFVEITYTALVAITDAARLGVVLEGLLIRPLQ